MNNLILPILFIILSFFHLAVRRHIRAGRVKEAFCALWCIDALFVICSIFISYAIYRYDLLAYYSWKWVLLTALYLMVTILFFFLTPSGFRLFKPNRPASEEALLSAEYRFNDTLCIIRNFFLLMEVLIPLLVVVLIPLLLQILKGLAGNKSTSVLQFPWTEDNICGALSFGILLILLPICIRQALYWLKSLRRTPDEKEARLLRNYGISLEYRHANRRM